MKYEEIFTYRNLYQAHIKARKGKRHKKDVINFELDLNNNLYELKKKLDNKIYLVTGYNKFVIFEPKRREIQSLYYFDRVVQHCIVDNYLMPLLDKHLIYDNGACRINKGTDFCRNRVKGFMVDIYKKYKKDFYVLQFDIRKYFENINHDVLKTLLEEIVLDLDIKQFLFNIIDSYNNEIGKGLPMGNQTSQCFSLLYLNKLDRLIKEKYRCKYYSRYMDDGIILHHNKQYLQNMVLDLNLFLNYNLKLEFNDKTTIKKMKIFKYLGFNYSYSNTGKILKRLSSKRKSMILKKVKRSKSINTITSYNGYLKRSNNYYFYKRIS